MPELNEDPRPGRLRRPRRAASRAGAAALLALLGACATQFEAQTVIPAPLIAACAAASLAIGTRGAEHET